jgi:hypothetical protein
MDPAAKQDATTNVDVRRDVQADHPSNVNIPVRIFNRATAVTQSNSSAESAAGTNKNTGVGATPAR